MNDIILHITYPDHPALIIFWTLSIGSLLVNLFLRRLDPPKVVERKLTMWELFAELESRLNHMHIDDMYTELKRVNKLYLEAKQAKLDRFKEEKEEELTELEKWRQNAGADVAFYGSAKGKKPKAKALQKGATLESITS